MIDARSASGMLAVSFIALSLAEDVDAQATLRSPYRGQEAGTLRGLSSEEINELREGRGMGLARAAELNGYPGPRHVLDAADAGKLSLSVEQRRAVEQLFQTMSEDARRLGDMILSEEQALEALFRVGTITESELRERVTRMAALRGELRSVHLRTRSLFTDDQIHRYNELRGYGHSAEPTGTHSH